MLKPGPTRSGSQVGLASACTEARLVAPTVSESVLTVAPERASAEPRSRVKVPARGLTILCTTPGPYGLAMAARRRKANGGGPSTRRRRTTSAHASGLSIEVSTSRS